MQTQFDKASDILREHLKNRGHRSTKERFQILKEIYSNDDHLNADEIYTRLLDRNISVSRATVYNTLELLVECNLIEGHQFGHNHMHYEKSFGFRHHDHLICNYCGTIIEFSMPELEMLQDEACRLQEFTPERHTLQIFGKCKKCRETNVQPAGEN